MLIHSYCMLHIIHQTLAHKNIDIFLLEFIHLSRA